MAKTRFSRKKKVKKPKFDVAHKKTDEYIDSHIADKIEDLILGPCYDEDRDAEAFSDFHARGKVKETINEDGTVIIEHAVEVLQFLAACPHLDPTHAIILLEDYEMEEAIKIGKTQIMTPRGMIPKWAETNLEDPLDQKFKVANAKAKKMEREVEKEKLFLGEDYVPGPVRKITEIIKEMIEAQDPAKIEECYTRVVWPAVLEPENVPDPKKKKNSKKVKSKNGSKGKELTTKKVIKLCKQSLKVDGSTKTTASDPPKTKSDAVKKSKELTKPTGAKKAGVAKKKQAVHGKSAAMKAKKGGSLVLIKENVLKYIKKQETDAGTGPSSVDEGVSKSSATTVKPNIKPKSTTSTMLKDSAKPPKRGSPGKENDTKIEKVNGAKKAMKAKGDNKKKPVLNE